MSKKNKIIIILILSGILMILVGVSIKMTLDNDKPQNPSNNTEEQINNDNNNEELNDENDNVDELPKSFKIDVDNLKILKSDSTELTNNIEVIKIMQQETSTIDSTYLIMYGKNNNKTATDVVIELALYDKDGYLVDYISTSEVVLAEKEFVLSLNLHTKVKYTSYALLYKAKTVNTEFIMFNDIKPISVVQDEYKNIIVNFKNTSKDVIDSIKFSCLFYKDGELVGATSTFNSKVEVSQTAEGICHTYIYDIDYDKYEVVLSSAYNYSNETSKW